jgi:MarR family transcriptional regulator, repressor for mepA
VDSSAGMIRQYLTVIGQRMKQLLNERLLPYDITPQQARIVGFVGTLQERGRVIYQKDIEEEVELRGPSITSLLQGLERKGFITRRVDPADERRKQVIVLAKGLDLLHDFEVVFQQIDQKLVQTLTAEQQQALLQALERMAHNVE